MSEYLRYIKQEWRGEIPLRVRGWWHRHWWPSHIRMLERERDDWKRWLSECEQKFVGAEIGDSKGNDDKENT